MSLNPVRNPMSARTEHQFHGRVQGVGFRYTTATIATGYRVLGFVRNCPDGTVELVAEGLESEVAAFISEVRRTFARNIHHESTHCGPATGEFQAFEIR
jgi:acylphosphatase